MARECVRVTRQPLSGPWQFPVKSCATLSAATCPRHDAGWMRAAACRGASLDGWPRAVRWDFFKTTAERGLASSKSYCIISLLFGALAQLVEQRTLNP